MIISLEKMLPENEFNQKIASILDKTGRIDIYLAMKENINLHFNHYFFPKWEVYFQNGLIFV
jgi:hypothetical protein